MSQKPKITRDDFVSKVTDWIIHSDANDKEIQELAKSDKGLNGVYGGKSAKIHRLVRLAYLRGVIRGASAAWEATCVPIVAKGHGVQNAESQE